MFRQLLVFYCMLATGFVSECKQATVKPISQNKTFSSCATKTPTPAPLKLADSKPTQPAAKTAAAPRTITVKSKITDNMLGYKKFGKHFPDKEFKIFIGGKELVNRQEIKENKTKTMKVTIKDDSLPVVFRYEFNHIWRNKGKGTRRICFKIPPTVDTVVLTFDWKIESQILIENIDGVEYIPDLSDKKQ